MVNHPFIQDLSDKTMEELLESISKLTKQQQFMFKMGKADVVNQINMIINSYRSEYQKRQKELWDKKSQGLDKKIDIS